MYIWEPQHNKQNHDFTRHCATPRPPPPPTPPPLPPCTQPSSISSSLWRSHASCVSPVASWNKVHILWHHYCYMLPVSCFNRRKKTEAFNVCMYNMLSWHWIERIKEENSRNKAELKDRKARRIKPVWLKIMVFSEKHEKEMNEEERVENEGLLRFCYIIEQNTERVESVSAWCPCCFPPRAELRVQSGINAHGERKRSHVWIFHSVHPFNACFPLLVISHSSRECSSLIPEKINVFPELLSVCFSSTPSPR